MKVLHWLVEEARSVALVTLYFAACFVVIMLLKQLWLAEHRDMAKVWATSITVGLSFLAQNVFENIRRAIGDRRMAELFLSRKATVA